MDKFPNRVKLIRYEDLLSKTGNISKDHLMHFLGVSFDETRVKTNIQSLNEWVARLNINVVEIVDLYCARVYENLGYIKLADIKEDRKAFLPFIPALQSNNGKRYVDAFEIQ